MSDKEHLMDLKEGPLHKPQNRAPSGLSGGACLNRHEGGAPCETARRNSCWHRWQAYEKMADETAYYDWPRYRKLVQHRYQSFRVAAIGMPPYAARSLPRPVQGEWNYNASCWRRVRGVERQVKNFFERASVPYNHQAHHLVANGELADSIVKIFSPIDSVVAVGRGLYKAEYNLNHKDNMINLPMDRVVSKAIGLPLHQSCWLAQSHPQWSAYVSAKLEPILAPLKKQLEQHKARDYGNVRKDLEDLAVALRNEVLATAEVTLDDMGQTQMQQQNQSAVEVS